MAMLPNNEYQMLINLIQTNSYPPFKEMQRVMEKRPDLCAEYGQVNHIWCQAIYDNPFDEDIVIKGGKIIYSRGGFTALQANFYIITFMWRGYGKDHLSTIFEKVTNEWKSQK